MKRVIFILIFCLVTSTVFTQTAQIAPMPNGGEFRVIEIREVTSSNRFTTPGENMRFIAVEIVIDNTNGTSDIELNIFTPTIEIRDSQGYAYTPNAMDRRMVKPDIDPNAKIETGEIMRGWVTLAIKDDLPIKGIRIRLNAVRTQSSWLTIQM